jgi:transcriptional regulator with XRE-family HTH domain
MTAKKIVALDSFTTRNELMAFAENLVRFRKERGFTQTDLAKKTKTGIAQLRRYEAGKSSPTLEVIAKLAKTLGVSSDELIFEEGKGVAAARVLDRELLDQFETISHFDREDLDAIKKVLDAFIVRAQVEQAMKRGSDRKVS